MASARGAMTLASAGVFALAVGCETRSEPYRFRAPLVGGVSAGDTFPDPRPEREATSPIARDDRDPLVAASEAIAIAATEPAGRGLAAELRGLVGRERDTGGDLDFALTVIERLGLAPIPELRAAHGGQALIDLAEARDALATERPLLGDLVVFDDYRPGEPASLVGVVVDQNDEGVAEFIYESRGIVRRGYVDPKRPAKTRGADGSARNTFVRPGRPGDPASTDYLAGELFSAFIRIDRLSE